MKVKRTMQSVLVIATLVTAAGLAPTADASTGDVTRPGSGTVTASGAAPTPGGSTADVDPRAASAMATQQGISLAEATKRLGEQKSLGEKGERIEKSLGTRTGGHYLDAQGRLVVTSLDGDAAATVTRGGARTQRVDDSVARLDTIKARLDAQAASSGAGAVQDWYVDVPTNTVVVTITDGAADPATRAMAAVAAGYGASVRIDHKPAAEAPRTSAEYLVGGAEFYEPDGTHVCSVGFNTLDSRNRNVVLTAGHCVKQSGNVSRGGYVIGATRTANFPGDDYGTFWNSYPSFWVPSISVMKYNGTYLNVRGWTTATVGTTVCKSGRTTGYTCGTVRAVNQTVNYPEGTIYGLVRHDACVEGGDSGGANLTPSGYALGMSSGASTPISGTYKGKCLSKTGQANISWYQPIGEALTANGLRLQIG